MPADAPPPSDLDAQIVRHHGTRWCRLYLTDAGLSRLEAQIHMARAQMRREPPPYPGALMSVSLQLDSFVSQKPPPAAPEPPK